MGRRPPTAIEAAVIENGAELQRCYGHGPKSNTALQGRLVLAWTVGTDGRVEKIEIQKNTLNDDSVAPCIVREIASWTFPSPPGGGPVEVEFPFIWP